ncbi:hypothetical protein E2C01_011826 [Portunus trituberculatus]|uniref:Uncharacterized protein n=1 Tax=Portunus trituberculatus TaxID=210409 RepID=A0A5B7DCI5_PORTR|nr:hypothetical protein [Portunus trituberculatus]
MEGLEECQIENVLIFLAIAMKSGSRELQAVFMASGFGNYANRADRAAEQDLLSVVELCLWQSQASLPPSEAGSVLTNVKERREAEETVQG